jgi:hypothetical protein
LHPRGLGREGLPHGRRERVVRGLAAGRHAVEHSFDARGERVVLRDAEGGRGEGARVGVLRGRELALVGLALNALPPRFLPMKMSHRRPMSITNP